MENLIEQLHRYGQIAGILPRYIRPVPNSDKHVILHVGVHKTASSLVQQYSWRRRFENAGTAGISVIRRRNLDNLIGYGKHVVEKPRRLRKRVENEFAKPWVKHVLLSQENAVGPPIVVGTPGLYPKCDYSFKGLKKSLKQMNVTLVVVIRPQESFLESYYLQTIHQGGSKGFREWLKDVDLEHMQWVPLVRTASRIFGRKNVRVLDFRKIKEGQTEFIRYFFESVDPSIRIDPSYDEVHNASVSAEGLKVALAANPYITGKTEQKAFRKFIQENFSNQKGARPQFFSPEEKAELERRYAKDYEDALGLRF